MLLMRTFAMRTAKAKIQHMGSNNQENCGDEKQQQLRLKPVFYNQQNDSGYKHEHRQRTVVMFLPAMAQGNDANDEGQKYHSKFKGLVVHDIDAEQRQARKKYGQHRAMYRAGERGGNARFIPIHPKTFICEVHFLQQYCKYKEDRAI